MLRWHIKDHKDGLRNELAKDAIDNPLYMITVEPDGSAILHEASGTVADNHDVCEDQIEWRPCWHFDNLYQARNGAETRYADIIKNGKWP